MADQISVLGRENVADASQVRAFAKRFKDASTHFAGPMRAVQPEFGAYMKYSIWQEVGTFGNRPPPRPHIRPSVQQNGVLITRAVTDYLGAYLRKHIGGSYTGADDTRTYEEAWLRVLNGPIRIAAVNLARSLGVREYGFHVRSIHGYARTRSRGQIKADQMDALRQRKLLRAAGRRKN